MNPHTLSIEFIVTARRVSQHGGWDETSQAKERELLSQWSTRGGSQKVRNSDRVSKERNEKKGSADSSLEGPSCRRMSSRSNSRAYRSNLRSFA